MKQIKGIWLPDADTHFEHHLNAGPEFAGAGTYQMKKINAALGQCHDRRRVAVDVGAHVGLWSRVLARHFHEVHAFEPLPHLQECFLANTQDCENVTLYHGAVSHQPGVLRMESVDDNSGNSRVGVDGARGTYPAHAVTLDGELMRISHKVDLIKIDVEGWELRVVEGARELIMAARPIIVVEQKPGNAERYGMGQRDAVKRLESWGAAILWEKAGDVCLGW